MDRKPLNILGIDMGGTKIALCLGNDSGKILGDVRFDNRNTDPEVILPQLVQAAKDLAAGAGLAVSDIDCFGISSPSPADIPNGIITTPPNNPYWRNVPIKQYLKEQLGIDGYFDNDANAGALAEWFFGAGKGTTDMVYLTMSTGIGGGIIAGGRLIRGKGCLAGEFGHTVTVPGGRQCNCGLKGCYEAYCGGRAVADYLIEVLPEHPESLIHTFLEDGKLENVDMIAFEKAIRANDKFAVELWDSICLRHSQALGTIINLLNPELIVLGTFAWAMGDLFMEPVKARLPEFAWKEGLDICRIEPSQLRRDIGNYAGIAVALNCLYEEGKWAPEK